MPLREMCVKRRLSLEYKLVSRSQTERVISGSPVDLAVPASTYLLMAKNQLQYWPTESQVPVHRGEHHGVLLFYSGEPCFVIGKGFGVSPRVVTTVVELRNVSMYLVV